MKKFTLTFALFCACCALAYAGPEPLPSGKEMKEVAPVPPPCPNWTGFYIGAFGGYKFGVFDPKIRVVEDEVEDTRLINSRLGENFDASGAELGGLIGYNYQWNKWVIGLEGAGGYLWLRNSETGLFSPDGGGEFYRLSNSLKTHYLATLGPRFGYAFCKWLPYVTGGVAFGDIDFEQKIAETDDFFEGRSKSEDHVGWFVGGGLQYALTHHWSARLQYQYVDLGDISFSHFSPGELTGRGGVDLKEHNASVAIIYQF
jgi:outer membrane immunogenic protein